MPNSLTFPDEKQAPQDAVEGMAGALMDLVKQRDWVSFVEIVNRLTKLGYPVAGDFAIEMSLCPNVFLWGGVSEELLDAIKLALDTRRVFLHLASPLTYMVDGHFPSWPVAKRAPVNGYVKPHWLPVCFRLVPPRRAAA